MRLHQKLIRARLLRLSLAIPIENSIIGSDARWGIVYEACREYDE